MVCNRCRITVKDALERIGIEYTSVELGEVNTKKDITHLQRFRLNEELQKDGFALIDSQANKLMEKLKFAIIEWENITDEDLKSNYTDFISLKVDENFISLNTLFSEIEGVTIEKYIVSHKVGKIKELLVLGDLTLTEIASKMHYSSVAQLSRQFKSVVGLTPADIIMLRQNRINKQQLN